MTVPTISVVIPMRDEAGAIEACLDALVAQDVVLHTVEVIVVDGASSDGSADVARRALARAPFARSAVVVNDEATTPSNLNQGLEVAAGRVLCRVDARSLVPPHYLRTCLEVLDNRPDVTVVGGSQISVSGSDDVVTTGIARALNNRFTMGMSRYRRGASSGPSDTVYLGAFRTDELREVGGWNETWGTNQDFELNRRMGERGIVWFDDRLTVGYIPRSTIGALWRQYRRFGRWKAEYWRCTGDRPQPRQFVALVAPVLAVAASTALVVTARRPLRRAGVLTASAAIGLYVVDEVGTSGPSGGLGVRSVSVSAMIAVMGGWSTGALVGVVGGGRR